MGDPIVSSVRGRPRSSAADSAIVAATMRLLGQAGYSQLTMAGVAGEAGVSTATLYRRYSNKLELVLDTVSRWRFRSPSPDTGTLVGDVRALTHGMAAFYVGEGGRIVKATIGELPYDAELAAAVRTRINEPRRRQIRDLVRRAVERGEIDTPADLDVFIDLVDGPFLARCLLEAGEITPEYADLVAAGLLGALGFSKGDRVRST